MIFKTVMAFVGLALAQSTSGPTLSADQIARMEDWINGIKNGTYNQTDLKAMWMDLEDEKMHFGKKRFSVDDQKTCIENDECKSGCCVQPKMKKGGKGGRGGPGGPDGQRRGLQSGDEEGKMMMRKGSFGGRGSGIRGRVCAPEQACDAGSRQTQRAVFISLICVLAVCLCGCMIGQYCYFKKKLEHVAATEQGDIQMGAPIPTQDVSASASNAKVNDLDA